MDESTYRDFLAERRRWILRRVRAACERVGRDAADVEVLCVSKTVDARAVALAREAGYRTFGENRPQELVRKLGELEAMGLEAPPFDMIGNLQTNKVNALIGRVRRIQSVSSLHLARAVSQRAFRDGVEMRVLLEVNVSGETTKSGFAPEDLIAEVPELLTLPGIVIEGLMTMAPAHDPAAARETFKGLRALARTLEHDEGLPLPVLSCGMSDDFEIAVEEGSTLLRLGRVVFDEDYPAGGGA